MTSRRILLVYAALAVLTAFYPAFFGELPVPAGNGLLLLPDGGAPSDRNDELTDVPTQFLPWTKAAADTWRTGRLPLRFSANGCGTPLWANPQAQAVTPPTVFTLVLPVSWGFAAAAAAKLFLAAGGVFFFLRARTTTPLPAFWAGLAFGFSLHMTCWMHFPHTWPLALFPWVLAALERVARGCAGGFPAALVAAFLLLLGGYPEGEFFVALFSAVFFFAVVLRQRAATSERLKRFGRAAAASLLALGLTAAYTLPATLAIVRGERSVQAARGLRLIRPTLSAKDFLRPPIYWEIARFWIVPEAQGNPRDRDKFGPFSFAGRTSGYAGILVLAFGIATFFWSKPPPLVVRARWAVVAIVLYVLWYPPLSYLLQAAPVLREVAVRLTTNRANGILVLLLALLAAHELERIRSGGNTLATKIGLAIALAATVLVTHEHAGTVERPPTTAWRAVSFALPAVLLLAGLVTLAGPLSRRRFRALSLLLLLGTGVDLLRIGARFNPGTRPADYFPVTPAVREIQRKAAGGRLASSEPTLTGMAYMYGLEDVRVHDVVAPADYEDVLGAAAGYTGPAEYNGRVTRLDAPILDFLNVRARLGPGSTLTTKRTPAAVFPERLIGAAPGELLARLASETDFERHAFTLGPDETFSGSAALLSFEKTRPEELHLRIRAESPRVLVVPETTDGGWTAEGNGARLHTFPANGAFLAIRVPAGETAIVCRYVPPGFRTGLAITAASMVALLAIWIRQRAARAAARAAPTIPGPR